MCVEIMHEIVGKEMISPKKRLLKIGQNSKQLFFCLFIYLVGWIEMFPLLLATGKCCY